MAEPTGHPESHDELALLLVPYALGLLDEAETLRVERVLKQDAALRAEYDEIQQTGAQLVGSVPLVRAPDSVKARVFEAIGAADHHPERGEASQVAAPAPLADARARSTRRSQWRGFALPAFAGAAAAACVALALVVIGLHDDLDAANSKLSRETRTMQAQVDEMAPHRVSTNAEMASAHGALLRVGKDSWVLVLRDVPDPGFGKSWQVWTKDQQDKVRNVAQWVDDGNTRFVMLESGDISEVMVSLENTTLPRPSPGGPPVATVRV